MKPRLIILVVLAGVLAVTFAMRSSAPPKEGSGSHLTPEEQAELKERHSKQLLVWQFPLSGEDPEEEPEFNVTVRVDTSTGHNRLVLEVSELHGYYVEYLQATVWYVNKEGDDPNDTPLVIRRVMNRYLEAGSTLVDCFEVVPSELNSVGGSIGESWNWRAQIDSHARARTENPANFPPVGGTSRCDN